MQRKFFTKKKSIYIQTIRRAPGGKPKELWLKQDKDGEIQPLVGGIHISRKKIRELIKEYPSSLLDKTYCFDADIEREFFEDAKRERFIGNIEDEETVIFFLIKKRPNRYGIGCSSPIERIEESD
jgi:hypothetical protein